MNATPAAPPQVLHCKRDAAAGAVYIGRPGPWGNPWHLTDARDEAARAASVAHHRAWFLAQPHLMRLARRTLRGRDLACWCAPRPCHGDVLTQVANDGGPAEEPVFVFGSNTAGAHGRGAALVALRHHGALRGQGEGPQGQAYAIPTKVWQGGTLVTAPERTVREAIERFLAYVEAHPETLFQLTRVGCGLAGLDERTVVGWFEGGRRLPNLLWPGRWRRDAVTGRTPPRIIVAGSRGLDPRDPSIKAWFDAELAARLAPLIAAARERRAPPPVILSGGAEGADLMGEAWAVERGEATGVTFERHPAEWDRWGRAAGMIRNARMAWEGTHLLAAWDGHSPGTRNMIETARDQGLRVAVITPPAVRPASNPARAAR